MNRLLLSLVLLLAGCAAGGDVVSKPRIEAPRIPDGPSVTRFEDGRKGFILSEIADLDADLRRDFDMAVEHLHSGDYEPAIELLEELIYKPPGITAPYINLAIAYRKIGVPEEAEDYLKTALQLVPGHPVASNEYGLLLRQAGRFAEARTVYEQTLTRFPEYLPVRRNLGILCDLYLNDHECAQAHFEEYSAANPQDQQVGLWLSELQLRQGQ